MKPFALVIEDDRDTANLIAVKLVLMGYDAQIAEGPRQATPKA